LISFRTTCRCRATSELFDPSCRSHSAIRAFSAAFFSGSAKSFSRFGAIGGFATHFTFEAKRNSAVEIYLARRQELDRNHTTLAVTNDAQLPAFRIAGRLRCD